MVSDTMPRLDDTYPNVTLRRIINSTTRKFVTVEAQTQGMLQSFIFAGVNRLSEKRK